MYDLARPTTVVHELLKDQMVDSYAGPYEGSKLIKAQDWQPFVRVVRFRCFDLRCPSHACITHIYCFTIDAT